MTGCKDNTRPMLPPQSGPEHSSWKPSNHAALAHTHLQYSAGRKFLLLHRQRDLRLAAVVGFGYFDPMPKCRRTWWLNVAVDTGIAYLLLPSLWTRDAKAKRKEGIEEQDESSCGLRNAARTNCSKTRLN